MVTPGGSAGSSWQSWVEATEGSPPSSGGGQVGGDDLDVQLDWGTSEPASSPRHAARDDSHDLPVADLGAHEDEEYDDADGELLPAVPLLPSIAGRVDAISGLLRSITMRLDGLNAATDVYRSAVTDRIDEYTETVLQIGRQSDQALEEYRRASERAIAELRRNASDRAETINRLVGRVEELTTDVASLVEAGGGGGEPVDLEPLLARHGAVEAVVAELGEVQAATEHRVMELRAAIDGLDGRQQLTDTLLGEVRTLVEAVVDTMPASAEGSALDLAAALEELKADVQDLRSRMPTKGPRMLLTRGDLDNAVELIAEAVVERIDISAIVDAVVEQMKASFEVVEDAPPGLATPPPITGRGGRLRRGG